MRIQTFSFRREEKMKAIKKFDEGLYVVEKYTAMTILVAMLAVVTLQVLNQSLLHLSITWTEEVCTILLMWFMLIGASIAIKKGSQLIVDFIFIKTKGLLRKILEVFIALFTIFTCAYIARSGYYLVQTHISRGLIYGITRAPYWVASLSIPVCFTLCTIRNIIVFIYTIYGWSHTEPSGKAEEGGENKA